MLGCRYIYIILHTFICAIEPCLTNKSWNHPFWGVDPTHLHIIGKKAIDHGLWEIWPISASWRLHFQLPDTIKPWDRAGEMPFTWPAKAAQPMVFPIFANTPRHTNFGEACGQVRWGHPNDDAAIPHSRSFPRLDDTFDPKLDEEEMERHNGPTKWPCTKVRDKNFSAHLQKLTHLEPFLPNGAMPLYLSLKKKTIQFHMASSIAHVKSCVDLKIVTFGWLLHNFHAVNFSHLGEFSKAFTKSCQHGAALSEKKVR